MLYYVNYYIILFLLLCYTILCYQYINRTFYKDNVFNFRIKVNSFIPYFLSLNCSEIASVNLL